jgi:hypothetical protein
MLNLVRAGYFYGFWRKPKVPFGFGEMGYWKTSGLVARARAEKKGKCAGEISISNGS